LHLSNACPERRIIICDSFRGFAKLDPTLDRNFGYGMFKDTSVDSVRKLFASKGRDYVILAGFFPDVCREQGFDLGRISFAHLDVDAYEPTIRALEYLQQFMLDSSLIVLDDYLRRADGVMAAVREFTAKNRHWAAFPMFPGQGLLVQKSWFCVPQPS
jgi:hypothetical protein